jgi:hypothetical protein
MTLCLSILLTYLHGHILIVYGPCLPVNGASECLLRPPVVWIEPERAARVG